MIYILIFILKLIENMISTLRLIMVSNGKKLAGALLQFICGVVFIISASLVIINFNEDVFKVLAFSLGCAVGSYIGCIIEEKMALGDNLILCITEKQDLSDHLREQGYIITTTIGEGLKNKKYILYIMISRKKRYQLIDTIENLDPKAVLISENCHKIHKPN